MKHRNLIAAVALAGAVASTSSLADVTIDESGKGFVGKGDVQSLYNWNNDQLQTNAHLVRFRYANESTSAWTCEGVNPAGKVVTTQHEEEVGVSSDVAFDPRRNRNGQVTGFILNGFEASSTYAAVGTCPPGNANWVSRPALVGEILYSGTGTPTLQVSIDGGVWHNLVLSYN